jgi:hypothetical protein
MFKQNYGVVDRAERALAVDEDAATESCSKPDCLDVQHNKNDESQRASEHRKFRVVAWTTRRFIGQLISLDHENHPDQNLMLLLESERKRRQLFAALLASASSTAAAQALAKL